MVRNLPIGFDNFRDIRDQDRLYVDKTDMADKEYKVLLTEIYNDGVKAVVVE